MHVFSSLSGCRSFSSGMARGGSSVRKGHRLLADRLNWSNGGCTCRSSRCCGAISNGSSGSATVLCARRGPGFRRAAASGSGRPSTDIRRCHICGFRSADTLSRADIQNSQDRVIGRLTAGEHTTLTAIASRRRICSPKLFYHFAQKADQSRELKRTPQSIQGPGYGSILT
jgi:hypothetical protein